jgi:hypothetical protein
MWRIAGHTRDPQRALDNLLTRDRMFTDRMRAETLRLGLPVITPEATMTEGDLAARVGRAFGLAS